MKILLMPNLAKINSAATTVETIGRLVALSAYPMLDDRYKEVFGEIVGCQYGDFFELLAICDIIVPIGGDGTILHTVQHAIAVDKPVIGINTGRVGFLTQLEGGELNHLSALVGGKYTIEKRMLLKAELKINNKKQSFNALNDIIISKESNKIVDLVVKSKDRIIARHRADGLIFATPTGSTGYSLSAGGCVVDPSISLMLMTAICPHSAYNRSIILPQGEKYTINEELKADTAGVYIAVDGVRVAKMMGDERVVVSKSKQYAKFINLGIGDFYENLSEKLSLKG